jgi:hypothetical protein
MATRITTIPDATNAHVRVLDPERRTPVAAPRWVLDAEPAFEGPPGASRRLECLLVMMRISLNVD